MRQKVFMIFFRIPCKEHRQASFLNSTSCYESKKDPEKASACHQVVSLGKFPGTHDHDLERLPYLLGKS
jgi:hypothetical protein